MNWNNLLNPENVFFSTVRRVLYLIELSVIWTVCCVPIVTVGPATVALYYSVVKAVRRERSYPVTEFWKAFKENFKNSAVITIVLFLVGSISAIADYLILLPSINTGSGVDYLLTVLLAVKVYLFVGVLMHSFPLVSRFQNGIIKTLENAFLLTVKHVIRTAALLILFVSCAAVVKTESLFLAIIPAVFCLAASFILEPMYQKYYTKADLDGTNGIADSWYDNTKVSDKKRDGFRVYRVNVNKEDSNNNQ